MIVVDASVVVELLLRQQEEILLERVLVRGGVLCAPHLLDLEVLQALRRLVTAGKLSAQRAAEAVADLEVLPVDRHPTLALVPRIWELRHHLTAYDAAYFALAETLGCPLVTRDRGFAGVPASVGAVAVEWV